MKRVLPYALAAAGFVLCAMFFMRSCDLGEKVGRLEGQLAEAKHAYAADKAASEALIADQLNAIAERDKAIALAADHIGDLNEAIARKTAALAVLDNDLAAAKTDAERVPILTAMVETWRAKYADLTGVVAEKDKQIGAWASKYDAQLGISSAYKAQLDKCERLLALSDGLNKALVSKARRLTLGSRIKTVALVAAAGGLTYLALKGK
jgi:hypothetical protein